MKFRVIPSLLTDQQTVVKGEKFNNWRTVGMAQAVATLFAKRNVDELLFLDVNASVHQTIIPESLVSSFSELLDIPFAIGGGIDSVEKANHYLRSGAEKIVIGTAAIENPGLISKLAKIFGSQAVVVTLDIVDFNANIVASHSGKSLHTQNIPDLAKQVQELGAGELVIQSIPHDGMLKGMNWLAIEQIAKKVQIPVIASSGASSPQDFLRAFELGASGVAAGAIFQFTQNTPQSIGEFLRESGVPTRTV